MAVVPLENDPNLLVDAKLANVVNAFDLLDMFSMETPFRIFDNFSNRLNLAPVVLFATVGVDAKADDDDDD